MRNKLWISVAMLLIGQLVSAQTGAVAYFRMNGTGDDQYANHSATINGAIPTTDRYGRDSSAYYFDGQDDYLEMSNLAALKFAEYTYSVWVKAEPISYQSYMPIISIGGANGDQGLHVANNYYGQSGFTGYGWTNCSNPQVAYGASSSIADTSWHHVLYTRSSTEGKVYVDGVLITTTSIPSNCPPHYATSQERAVLGTRFNQTKYFKGKLDELKIFNYALGADEVLAVYENSSTIGACYLDVETEESLSYSSGVLTSNTATKTTASFLKLIVPGDLCELPYGPSSDLGDLGLLGLSVNLNSFGTDSESYAGLGFKQQDGDYYLELGRTAIHVYKNQEIIYTAQNKTQIGDRIELGLDQEKVHFYKNGLEIGEPQVLTSADEGFFYTGLIGNATAIDRIRVRTICEEQDFNSNAKALVINSTTYECMDFVAGPPYYELKDELDGAFYDCVSATVYFRYKESYLSETNLGYTIYDNSYNDVTTSFTLENLHRQDAKKEYGTSYFKLQGDNSTSGFYILEVYDAKGQAKYLRFKI